RVRREGGRRDVARIQVETRRVDGDVAGPVVVPGRLHRERRAAQRATLHEDRSDRGRGHVGEGQRRAALERVVLGDGGDAPGVARDDYRHRAGGRSREGYAHARLQIAAHGHVADRDVRRGDAGRDLLLVARGREARGLRPQADRDRAAGDRVELDGPGRVATIEDGRAVDGRAHRGVRAGDAHAHGRESTAQLLLQHYAGRGRV